MASRTAKTRLGRSAASTSNGRPALDCGHEGIGESVLRAGKVTRPHGEHRQQTPVGSAGGRLRGARARASAAPLTFDAADYASPPRDGGWIRDDDWNDDSGPSIAVDDVVSIGDALLK